MATMEKIDLNMDSVRDHTLQCAKNFKTSWVDLGRALYTVWKDKLYKTWNYSTFDAYTQKEINIRKLTALKLLRSYFFLEKEEPQYLKEEFNESAGPASIPSYESIDILRRAKGRKELDSQDYHNLRNKVFEKGKDSKEIRKDLTALIKQREELSPEEAFQKRQDSNRKRLLSLLKSLKTELEVSKSFPHAVLKDIDSLIKKVEDAV